MPLPDPGSQTCKISAIIFGVSAAADAQCPQPSLVVHAFVLMIYQSVSFLYWSRDIINSLLVKEDEPDLDLDHRLKRKCH